MVSTRRRPLPKTPSPCYTRLCAVAVQDAGRFERDWLFTEAVPCMSRGELRVAVSQHDLHEKLFRAEELRQPSERAFGLTLAVALFIVTVVFALRGSDVWPVLLAFALLLSAVAVIAPGRLRPLNRLWMRFGMALHSVISPVILFILFFTVITPTAVLARLFGKDFLRLKFDKSAPTYWIDRKPPGPRPESLRNQF